MEKITKNQIQYRSRIEAAEFRNIHGLGPKEAIRLDSLLMKLGVVSVFKPLSDNFSGMAIKAGDLRFMMINSNDSIGRQHFTLCHELYHLFVQEDFGSMVCETGRFDYKFDRIEFHADCFASNLLLPDDGIESMVPFSESRKDSIRLATLLKIEQYYSCSRLALLFKLLLKGYISREFLDKHKANVQYNARQHGYTTRLYDQGNHELVIGSYGEKAKDLFEKGLISEAKYLSYMSEIGFKL